MNLTLWHLLTIIPPLLLIEGFFAGSEIALLSADRMALRSGIKRGSRGAELALELSRQPERILSTTLLMTNICMIAISALITFFMLAKSPDHGEVLAVLVTSPMIVLLGELIPKAIYQRYADKVAPVVAHPVYWFYWIFYPVTRSLSSYSSRISKIVAPIEELVTGKKRTTRDEIQLLLSYGSRESEIKTSEKRMIRRIFEFKDSEAKHALIPLVRVDAIEDTATVTEALELFQRNQHSRMPVYSDRIDNIIGIIDVADLFPATDLAQSIRNYITPAHYAAENQSLQDLLLEMRREDIDLAVVVDEYGGAVGILAFEDIVEEIVGEINDEYDPETSSYKEINSNKWLVQARMEIQQINEQLHLDVPEGDYETLGGFLLMQFGRIPEPRDELFFDTKSGLIKFTVRKATERYIENVAIERTPKSTRSPNDESEG